MINFDSYTMLSIRLWTIRNNFRLKKIPNLKICKKINFSIFSVAYRPNKLFYNTTNSKEYLTNNLIKNSRLFSSEQLAEPRDPDVFGDLSEETFERIELDKDEKEHEEFEKHESYIPRRLKLSPGQYANLIKENIRKGDLDAALGVLDLVKSNRDKPTTYMYNLLIRAYATQGDLRKALKLYNGLKKRALKPNGATYTSVLNACATTQYHSSAMIALKKLRVEFLEKNIVLNAAHYNAMIKAYGLHNQLVEAFRIVDLMIDKKFSINESTFNSLLYVANSDKENGLRHALVVWHRMQMWRIKPTLATYNLLLRGMRDTNLGDLKINDKFIENHEGAQIVLDDNRDSDLLAYSPSITSYLTKSVLSLTSGKNENNKNEGYLSSAAPTMSTTLTEHKAEVEKKPKNDEVTLQSIHENNRLILFGGYNRFLERIEQDGITPDEKTFTLLIETTPGSLAIEKDLIELARKKKVNLDIDFFNILIKKRCFRKDYKNAKLVLDDIQRYNLSPNIMTWGVLALSCVTHHDGIGLLENMKATGYRMNAIIAGALMSNASTTNNFDYMHDIIEKMIKLKVRPSPQVYQILDRFQQKIKDIITGKVKLKHSKKRRYREQFAKFNRKYAKLQEQFDRDIRTAHR